MMKKLLIAGSALVGLLLIVTVGLAMFLDVNQFRPRLEQEFASVVGRKVSLGEIKLALLSGSVSVANVTIADDPAFGSTPFVTAKAVKVGVELMPLVLSRTLHVRSFTLEEPHISVRRSASNQWNFSTVGTSQAAKSSPAANDSSSVPSFSVAKLSISNGEITVTLPGARGKNRVYESVNIDATDLSYQSQFPFHLAAKTPGGGSIRLDGKAGPLSPTDASTTPIDATVKVKSLDLLASGFVDPASGLAGLLDFDSRLVSDGRQARSKGTLSATRLQVVQGSKPAQVPVRVDYQSSYDLKRRNGTIDQGDVHIGQALSRLTGNYNMEGTSTMVRLKLAGHQMPVPDLEAALPAIGVTLPAGASLKGGTMDLDLSITGPVDHLVTSGPVKVADTTVTGFDLGAKMAVLAVFAGVPSSANTLIQAIGSSIRVAPDGIRADNLELVAPSIGTLTGAGTISPQGALDFKMVAKLASNSGMTAAVSRVTPFGSVQNAPFLVKGTTSSPIFTPDMSAVVGSVVNKENATKAATGLLKGILGRKPR
jgi:AsmA protein